MISSAMARPTNDISSFAASMRALGRDEPPARFVLAGQNYHRQKVVKHDFWAATAFYESDDGRRAVAKINRNTAFVMVPFAWVGRWLCRREVRFYSRLQHIRNVPRLLGRMGSTGYIHDYVPGTPLAKGMALNDHFFNDLKHIMAAVHQQDAAYVDANKRENILVGEDGAPYLIDFQISFDLHEFGDNSITRRILRHFQAADRYHILKHQRRLAPNTLTTAQRYEASRIGWLTKLHRAITMPYFAIRRPLFRKLRDAGYILPEGSK
jgi:RIO-like serine/threonine protein kinase